MISGHLSNIEIILHSETQEHFALVNTWKQPYQKFKMPATGAELRKVTVFGVRRTDQT